MNKRKSRFLLFCLLSLFASFVAVKSVFATVGGSKTISMLAYDETYKFLYYRVNDSGGRGCPPIVHFVDLLILKDGEVKSCDEAEKIASGEGGGMTYNQFLADTYGKLSYLGSVSLKKNNIDISIEHLRENLDVDGYAMWNEFRATVTQDGKELAKIDFRGCAKDQPHVFEGYMVPNSDALALLLSNKSDCFEGGYIGESLHIVKGVKYYDTTIERGVKGASPTEPNGANMIVYADSNGAPEAPATSKNTEDIFIALVSVVLIIVVTVLGFRLGRKPI